MQKLCDWHSAEVLKSEHDPPQWPGAHPNPCVQVVASRIRHVTAVPVQVARERTYVTAAELSLRVSPETQYR